MRNWPNTIEALRLKKEVGRKERLDREEEIRAAQDVQEADYQASQREAVCCEYNFALTPTVTDNDWCEACLLRACPQCW